MASSVAENPSIPPRRPISVKCMPLPSMMSTMPSRRAQTPDKTLIMGYPFAAVGWRTHSLPFPQFSRRQRRGSAAYVINCDEEPEAERFAIFLER